MAMITDEKRNFHVELERRELAAKVSLEALKLASKVPVEAMEEVLYKMGALDNDKDYIMMYLVQLLNTSGKFKHTVEVVGDGDPRLRDACITNPGLEPVDMGYLVDTACAGHAYASNRADAVRALFAGLALDGKMLDVDMISWHREPIGTTASVYFGISKKADDVVDNDDKNTDSDIPSAHDHALCTLNLHLKSVRKQIDAEIKDGKSTGAEIDALCADETVLSRAMRIVHTRFKKP